MSGTWGSVYGSHFRWTEHAIPVSYTSTHLTSKYPFQHLNGPFRTLSYSYLPIREEQSFNVLPSSTTVLVTSVVFSYLTEFLCIRAPPVSYKQYRRLPEHNQCYTLMAHVPPPSALLLNAEFALPLHTVLSSFTMSSCVLAALPLCWHPVS